MLDDKEKELIKKRNANLFTIKLLEQQLEELKNALAVLEIQAQPPSEQRLIELREKMSEAGVDYSVYQWLQQHYASVSVRVGRNRVCGKISC